MMPSRDVRTNKQSDPDWTSINDPIEDPTSNVDEMIYKTKHKDEHNILSKIPDRVDNTSKKQDKAESANGYLFVNCIRCASAIAIQFSSGFVPKMSNTDRSKYRNGIMLTICSTCKFKDDGPISSDIVDADKIEDDFQWVGMSTLMM